MVKTCALCGRLYDLRIQCTFFSIPKDGRRQRWIAACGQEIDAKDEFVCEYHFEPSDVVHIPATNSKRLSPCAVPKLKCIEKVYGIENCAPNIPPSEEETDMIRKLKNENWLLRQEVKKQKAAMDVLKTELSNATSTLKILFSENQIRKLQRPEMNLHWSKEDIAEAKALYAVGPKAYKFLRRKGYPLPNVSTLRRYVK